MGFFDFVLREAAMTGSSTRSRQLRNALDDGHIFLMPAVFNAISARIARLAGAKALWLSNAAVSASLIGEPDLNLLTSSEVAMVAGYIADSVDAPLVADAEAGFGNAINSMRTTEHFIKAGAAGMQISDRVHTPTASRAELPPAPLEEAVGKFRAVARVRDELDPEFVLIVRLHVTAGMCADVPALLERVRAYGDAGIDVVIPPRLDSADEIGSFCLGADRPVCCDAAVLSQESLAGLEKAGVRAVLAGHGALAEASRGMWDYLHAFLREDIAVERRVTEELQDHPLGNFHAFVGFPEIRALEELYLPRDEVVRKYQASVGIAP